MLRIIDAHEDIAWEALTLGRDVLHSAWETRRLEKGTNNPQYNGQCMLGLPEWLEGGVVVVFGTLFLSPARRALGPWDFMAYADEEEAHQHASAQLDYYHRLADQSDQMDLVGTRTDLEGVLASWEGEKSPRVGIVPLMEGADPVRRPGEVEAWYRRGVRLVALTWATRSRFAGGNKEPGPLTDEGRVLLEALADVGMILDVSHLAEAAFFETIDRYEGMVVASHANPRAFVPIPRCLSDSMIRAVAERDGVIGVVPFNRFLKPGWELSDGKEVVSIGDVAAAVDHVCQVVGNAAHVGLGSDFDGGFGAGSAPAGLETVADLPKIAGALAERGFAESDIAAVMGENWLRVLLETLPAG